MDPRAAIRQLLQDLLIQKGDQQLFNDSDSLVLSGRLQSIDAVEIVVFLEEKWGIDFARIGFDESLIDSIDAIDALIHRAETTR